MNTPEQTSYPLSAQQPGADAARESGRLAALHDTQLFDPESDADFDLLVQAAAALTNSPYAFVSLIDAEHAWQKAAYGMARSSYPRQHSLCALAVAQTGPGKIFHGDRTGGLPPGLSLADGTPMCFYVGALLETSEGHRIGTLCIVDSQPRVVEPAHVQLLAGLARQAMQLIELRRLRRELRSRMDELEQMSMTDELTGLLNRRALMQFIQHEHANWQRHRMPYALCLLDLDHFKSINDSHGHAVGDIALQALARALRRSTRSHDKIGRLGGDEFCVLMPGTSTAQAELVLQRVRQDFQIEGWSSALPRPSFSAGIASGAAGSVADALQRADEALYRAKRQGRDRVALAT